MRKFALLLGLVLISAAAQAQSKIGTIDAEYILAQMPEIEEVNKGLEAYGSELQVGLDSTITQYETKIKDYQERGETLAEEERKTLETEIISLENEIKNFRQKASVMIQMRRNELTKPLYDRINEAMLKVIDEEGFTQIFHAGTNVIAYSGEEHDITMKVLAQLGIEVVAE